MNEYEYPIAFRGGGWDKFCKKSTDLILLILR